jgi:hypothetical protein
LKFARLWRILIVGTRPNLHAPLPRIAERAAIILS